MSQEFTERLPRMAASPWTQDEAVQQGSRPGAMLEQINRAKQGDMSAIDAIAADHHGAVYRVCYRMMGNHEDAQDASQETFIRMLKAIAKYDAARPFTPWLFAIALNVCRDLLRKRKLRHTEPLDSVDSRRTAIAPEVLRKMSAEEEMAILEDGLRRLPAQERAAIVLRDIEGLTTAETAESLGTKEETVRSQISRVRVKLKAYRDSVRRNES